MIKANLDVAVSMHSDNCDKTAVFSTVEYPGITNLLMTCEVGCILSFCMFLRVIF